MKTNKDKLIIEFVFEGEPLTKSNAHIFRRRGGKGVVFIPKRISDYETNLHNYVSSLMQKKCPTKNLVKMTIHYYYGTKRRKDLQNQNKTQCDALNGVVYADDSQIHEIHEYRHLDRARPRVEVRVEEITDESWTDQ